jgi:hypothetical protein
MIGEKWRQISRLDRLHNERQCEPTRRRVPAAQWFYGLLRAPRRPIRLVTVVREWTGCRTRSQEAEMKIYFKCRLNDPHFKLQIADDAPRSGSATTSPLLASMRSADCIEQGPLSAGNPEIIYSR